MHLMTNFDEESAVSDQFILDEVFITCVRFNQWPHNIYRSIGATSAYFFHNRNVALQVANLERAQLIEFSLVVLQVRW